VVGPSALLNLVQLDLCTDPQQLPPFVVADLYRRRWRIEEALHSKTFAGTQLSVDRFHQWSQVADLGDLLFYAVLADLGDASR